MPGGDSLLAVLVSIRSNVVTAAASIAIVTATAKSMTAVRWLFRWLGMRKPPQHRKTLCGLDGSTHLRLRAPKFGTGSVWYSRLTRWKMVGSGLNSRDGDNCSMQLRRRVRRTEEKFLVPHTDDAICAVCGAALESWSEHPNRKPERHGRNPSSCPFRVKNGSRGLAAGCQLWPDERTSSGCLGMSEKCQMQTPRYRTTFRQVTFASPAPRSILPPRAPS